MTPIKLELETLNKYNMVLQGLTNFVLTELFSGIKYKITSFDFFRNYMSKLYHKIITYDTCH